MKKLALVLLLIASHSIIQAQSEKVAPGWRKIAETEIDFKKEAGEIIVTTTKRYSAVKIKMINATINLESFDIYLASGEMQRVDLHQLIKSDSESNAAMLSGKKAIKRVDLKYKSIGIASDVKPVVELWAL
ncbi:hypothetical protein [Flavobacterium terrisoli]|uniref:hypothetical protein n=1 Tax=Flavobacterium terrisoli TaxID=3242195 RepID=UPI0025433DCD|nr:hypothetical protein [Flavobacterium buctense]